MVIRTIRKYKARIRIESAYVSRDGSFKYSGREDLIEKVTFE